MLFNEELTKILEDISDSKVYEHIEKVIWDLVLDLCKKGLVFDPRIQFPVAETVKTETGLSTVFKIGKISRGFTKVIIEETDPLDRQPYFDITVKYSEGPDLVLHNLYSRHFEIRGTFP